MSKPNAKKATAITAAAKKAGTGMFVFATIDTNLLSDNDAHKVISGFKYVEHSCTDCSLTFGAPVIAGLSHSCVACGSGSVEVSETVVKPEIASDEKLAVVNCASCQTHNVLPASVVASTNALHCTVCASPMTYKVGADVLDDLDLGDNISLDDDALDDADELSLDSFDDDGLDTLDDLDTLDIEDDDDSSVDDGMFDETSSSKKGKPHTAADDAQDSPSKKDGENRNEIPSDAPLDVPTPSQGPADKMAPDATLTVNPPETQPIKVDLLSEFDKNEDNNVETDPSNPCGEETSKARQLAFAYFGDTMAIVGGTTVLATLNTEQAGQHQHQTREFQEAVAHTIRTLGLKQAVANYKFVPATITVNVGAEAFKVHTAKLEKAQQQVTAKVTELAADFQQSLDIAAAGFAANFWRNKPDPVKAALITELTTLGIRKADVVVDRVFAAHGVAQVREILEMARVLAQKPVEARNGLAESMNLAKYQPSRRLAAADEEDGGDGDDAGDQPFDTDDGEDGEEAAVRPVAKAAHLPTPVTSSATFEGAGYQTPQLRALLGNQPLFR